MAVAAKLARRHRSVAVIAVGAFVDDLRDVGGDGVTVLDAPEAKGLEFDAVVVAPERFLAAGPRGARLLYIALTRTVQELTLVHAAVLPTTLASGR